MLGFTQQQVLQTGRLNTCVEVLGRECESCQPKGMPKFRLRRQLLHSAGQRDGIAGSYQQAGSTVFYDLGDTSLTGADHRAGLCHGLSNYTRQTFGIPTGRDDARDQQ